MRISNRKKQKSEEVTESDLSLTECFDFCFALLLSFFCFCFVFFFSFGLTERLSIFSRSIPSPTTMAGRQFASRGIDTCGTITSFAVSLGDEASRGIDTCGTLTISLCEKASWGIDTCRTITSLTVSLGDKASLAIGTCGTLISLTVALGNRSSWASTLVEQSPHS